MKVRSEPVRETAGGGGGWRGMSARERALRRGLRRAQLEALVCWRRLGWRGATRGDAVPQRTDVQHAHRPQGYIHSTLLINPTSLPLHLHPIRIHADWQNFLLRIWLHINLLDYIIEQP